MAPDFVAVLERPPQRAGRAPATTSAACCSRAACRRCRTVAFERPERAQAMRRDADDADAGQRPAGLAARCRWARCATSPTPRRSIARTARTAAVASDSLRELIESAQQRSAAADALPGAVQSGAGHVPRNCAERPTRGPRVIVSTNSLAATDAFIAYALSYKYKRRYLREFGFNIFEYKPFPADAPIDIADHRRAPLPESELPASRPRTVIGRQPEDEPVVPPSRHRELRDQYDRRSVVGARALPPRAVARMHGPALRLGARPTSRCRSSAPACASACTPSRW